MYNVVASHRVVLRYVLYTYHSIYRLPIKTCSKWLFIGLFGADPAIIRGCVIPMIIIISRKLVAFDSGMQLPVSYQCFLLHLASMAGDLNITSGPV